MAGAAAALLVHAVPTADWPASERTWARYPATGWWPGRRAWLWADGRRRGYRRLELRLPDALAAVIAEKAGPDRFIAWCAWVLAKAAGMKLPAEVVARGGHGRTRTPRPRRRRSPRRDGS